MEDSTSILIDETYEFFVPRFYDFFNGETRDDILNSEMWFETTNSDAPTPSVLRIGTGRFVQPSSLCDFEQTTKIYESLQKTTSTLNASEKFMSSETKENLNPNLISDKTSELVVDQLSVVDKRISGVSYDSICKEDGSTSEEPTAAKTEPVIHKEVSTPKPTSISEKGASGSSELKKRQIARKIAAVLKNPSALKSKMQSPLSRTKSAKPSSVKRDTSHLKSSTQAPNLVQENQAIKRQKLDGGKSRQILSIKPPDFPHKTTPTTSNMCSSEAKSIKDGRKIYARQQQTQFVSMAEMIKKFQSSTKDGSLPHNSLAQPKLCLTRPKVPEFVTAQRVRLVRVKSSVELEEEMMAKMPKFQARPLNKKILEVTTLPPLSKSAPQLPEFQEFHLETKERASKNAEESSVVSTESCHQEFHLETKERASKNAEESSVVSTESCHQNPKYKPNYLTEPKTPMLQTSLRARPTKVKSALEIQEEELEKIPKFKARPLNKKIFEGKGEMGLFRNTKKQVTIPKEFHFAVDERIPPPTPTTNVTDLFDKLSLSLNPTHCKPIPTNTKPNPFHLHTEERGEEKERKFITEITQKQLEDEQARIPKAKPYPYSNDYPLIPPRPDPKEATNPEPFHLESLVRHEEEMKREMEDRQKSEVKKARMRVFKARPVLKEDPIPIAEKERRPLTQIQEFNLHSENRAVDRSEFEKSVKEKEMMHKRYRDEAEAERHMEEEKALKQLRRTMVPHATPVPNFANPFVPQKACKETTTAKSPKLCVFARKEKRGLSFVDIKAASIR